MFGNAWQKGGRRRESTNDREGDFRGCCSQWCGSGMFIPNSDYYPSRIQKQQQKRGVKKISCHTYFCRHKFRKIENYFIFEMLKEKIWANFQRIIELFSQKFVTKLLKIWVWNPSPEKNYSGSGCRGQKGTGSATLIAENIFRIWG